MSGIDVRHWRLVSTDSHVRYMNFIDSDNSNLRLNILVWMLVTDYYLVRIKLDNITDNGW